MLAVIETGGKQYRVKNGQMIKVEKVAAEKGETIDIDRVLMVSDDDNTVIGKPFVEGAKVRAKVLDTYKDRKVLVFRKKPRKGFKSLRGHRQLVSKLLIEDIVYGG
ncbi:50S ribosomal protein L21 [bacterium BMS3Bbin06]|nr:50S ribosomal protein L21 [bacterium BMS3Abin08]GBE35178.1 50S ribosomal protein L21 [bacterium BMS3Bbin06]HDO36696.1 50S ribosomal protein L21 [Nitrospirota bacterium]HDY71867.1 50S ribosomal protein L21 [Nitrospirota bacterium]